MSKKEAINKIAFLIEEASKIAKEELNIDNIFYNEGYVDLLVSSKLNHTYNIETQGADAFDNEGKWAEYKTINESSKSTGSFQFHWISKEKLEKYNKSNFYFIVRNGTKILRIYTIEKEKIMFHLIKAFEEGERKRLKLKIKKSINAHKSFSEKTLIKMGAKLIYKNE